MRRNNNVIAPDSRSAGGDRPGRVEQGVHDRTPRAGERPDPAAATTVSVPGKLILMGEHSVVYHRPALVAAVSLRLQASIARREGTGVRLVLPQLGVRETTSWSSVLAYARGAQNRWQAFADQPSPDRFRLVRGEDPAHVVKVALGETAAWLEASAGSQEPTGAPGAISVTIDSEIPIGSGLGSSAATAVGTISAYLAHRGRAADARRIDRLALDVERRQHGLPSGVDHATVLQGGVLWARKNSDGSFSKQRLDLPSKSWLSMVRLYDSGPPAESTGAVVSSVRERLAQLGAEGRQVLDRMEAATLAFRDRLVEKSAGGTPPIEPIRECERCLEELGAVPEAVRHVVRRVEAEGGAAKISGAGALSGSGAGCLLVYHPEPERIGSWEFLKDLTSCPVVLGVEGLCLETSR